MRQALFNILSTQVEGADVLDVFGGTGLMGFEAMSRGAKSLTVIERDKNFADAIRNNAESLGFECKVLAADFRTIMPRLTPSRFDLIFADPPYKTKFGTEVLSEVDKHGLLNPNGIVVVEHLGDYQFDVPDLSLQFQQIRKYGRSAFSFFVAASI